LVNLLNLFFLLIIWVIVWFIPIPPKRFRLKSVARWVSLVIGLFLFFVLQLFHTPLSIFTYVFVFSRALSAFVESAFSFGLRRLTREEKETRHVGRPFWKVDLKAGGRIIAVLFLVYVVAAASLVVFAQVQRVTNAVYFNSFIKAGSGLPFNWAVPDNMVRLVTQELAVSIARRHMSEFGSNTQVLDCHVTKSSEGKLVWLAVIGSTNVIAENYVKGFVVVDATDPTAIPTTVHTQFQVGEGLWWDHNIPFRQYMQDISRNYGIAYATWDTTTNSLTYVLTRYNTDFDFVRRYETPIVYDEQGNIIHEPKTLAEIPLWVTQVYDEDWLESMINEMGLFRRGGGFDYWAGGFLWIVAPSRDRFQMTEDTRYVVDPETEDIVALVCVNPIGNQRTLAGVFKATREDVIFYDYKSANYLSGMTAEDMVEGRLPKPATGNYYATMPLLYPVETSPNNYELSWYVPVYWYEMSGEVDETIYLAGFAIVDASDANKIVLTMNNEGLTSEQLVRKTRLDFMKLFGATTYLTLNVTVLNIYNYVEDGTSHLVLNLANDTYPFVEATPKDVPTDQWNELLATVTPKNVTIYIEKRGNRWIVTYFDNPNIP